MEEVSNGKIEDTQKEESQENGVVEEMKSEVREIALDGNDSSSDSSSSDEEAQPNGESTELEEKEVIDSVVDDLVEPVSSDLTQEVEIPVEDSGDSNVVELESEEIKEQIIESESKDAVEEALLVMEETETNKIFSDEVKEKTLPCLDDAEEVSQVVGDEVSKGIEEVALPSETDVQASDVNTGEESKIVSEETTKEPGDDSLKSPADIPAAIDNGDASEDGNKTEITENTRTSPILSISSRTVQPTSWRSCCGLFEVLRRNR